MFKNHHKIVMERRGATKRSEVELERGEAVFARRVGDGARRRGRSGRLADALGVALEGVAVALANVDPPVVRRHRHDGIDASASVVREDEVLVHPRRERGRAGNGTVSHTPLELGDAPAKLKGRRPATLRAARPVDGRRRHRRDVPIP